MRPVRFLLHLSMLAVFFHTAVVICARADEVQMTSGNWLRDCKVRELPDGRYEIRVSHTSAMKVDAKDLDLSTVKRGRTTWEDKPPDTQPPDTQPPDAQPPDTQPPDTQPPDTQPPPPPKPPADTVNPKLQAFMDALKRMKDADAALSRRNLILSESSVYELVNCSNCRGEGRVSRTVLKTGQCPTCRGRGRAVVPGSGLVTCPRCRGSGYVSGNVEETRPCQTCEGRGLRRGNRKGAVTDLALLVPEIGQCRKALEDAADAAAEILANEKQRELPDPIFVATAQTVGRYLPGGHGGAYETMRNTFRTVPDDKGFLLTYARVVTSMPEGNWTTILLQATAGPPGYPSVSPQWRGTILVPGQPKIPANRCILIRGTVTGRKEEVYVIGDFQMYPDISKGD